MSTETHYLAVDLGATSGRTILATFDGSKVGMRELTRFKHPMVPIGRHLYWDLPHLFNEILEGLKKVAAEGIEIQSVGIDTWGVDFAFFGKDGQPIGLPHCYRDEYTTGAMDRFFADRMLSKEVYAKTGIQFMEFNSLFQLDTQRREGSSDLEAADKILFMPDALTYMLTGEAVCEYTIASTSQILNPVTGDLDADLLKTLKLDRERFGRLVQPGEVVGTLTPQVQKATGLGPVKVVAVAGHDTASAVVSVPAKGAHFAYLSCGTWSLLGIESPKPIINEQSFRENFTNEGGIDGTTRFLKNICGLWIFEKCREDFYKDPVRFPGAPQGIKELTAKCLESDYDGIIFPDDDLFVHPDSMTAAICEFCRRTGQKAPETVADYLRCIYRSLALRYKEVIALLAEMGGFPIESLNVIGGGSQNPYLMQFAADALGFPVICGPTEGTALGNTLVQLRAVGKVGDLWQMRAISAASVELKTYFPQK